MKKYLLIASALFLMVIFSGGVDSSQAPQNKQSVAGTSQAAPDAKNKQSETVVTKAEQQTVQKKENKPVAKNLTTTAQRKRSSVVANETFSNIQISDPTIPIYDKLTVAERQEKGLRTALPPLVHYEKEKIAYLTFDDGPEDENTPAVLDILKENNIKATFYLVGSYVAAYPEVVERIYAEGHAIGNHSYSHVYDDIYASPEALLAELEQTDEQIKAVIGVRPLILRAPGGSMGQLDDNFWAALEQAGYVEHDWNVSIADAAPGNPTAEDFVCNIINQTEDGKQTAVVLMHSSGGHEETVKALPEIIQILKERGYRFGVVSPLTPDV